MKDTTARVIQDAKIWFGDIWIAASRRVLDALALFGGVAGVSSALSQSRTVTDNVSQVLDQATSACVALWFLSTLGIVIYSAWETRQSMSTQSVPFAHNTYLHIISGEGYIENLEKICFGNHKYQELVCVCGLNTMGSLAHSSAGGITRSLMLKIIEETSGISKEEALSMSCDEIAQQKPIKALQEQVDWEASRLREKRAQVCGTARVDTLGQKCCDADGEIESRLSFGDCIMVQYDRSKLAGQEASSGSRFGGSGLPESFNILFLVNSAIRADASGGVNVIEGPDSSSLLKNIFSFLEKRHLDLLFMPALGTNRLDNDHQSVIATIVQTYCSQVKPSRRLYDLAISVRKESMDWDGLSLVCLRRYISEALRFYN